MTVREDKIWQSWLFPPCIADFIPADHICNLVAAVVGRVEVGEVEKKYRFKPGNPAYPRRMLLRLVVQAAIDGVWSSRKIDKLAHENVVCMYLAGNEKPFLKKKAFGLELDNVANQPLILLYRLQHRRKPKNRNKRNGNQNHAGEGVLRDRTDLFLDCLFAAPFVQTAFECWYEQQALCREVHRQHEQHKKRVGDADIEEQKRDKREPGAERQREIQAGSHVLAPANNQVSAVY